MSVVAKIFLLMLGIRRKEETKKPKQNAVKFSKALKQQISEDAMELSIKIDELKKAS